MQEIEFRKFDPVYAELPVYHLGEGGLQLREAKYAFELCRHRDSLLYI